MKKAYILYAFVFIAINFMIKTSFQSYTLKFKFEAGTSRGVLTEKKNYFIKLSDEQNRVGIGEVNVLKGLSIDDREDLEDNLKLILKQLEQNQLDEQLLKQFPSIRFAIETAQKDLQNGGKRIIYSTDFAEGKAKIPINGLIWMGTKDFMLKQVTKKIAEGFRCLKMKIGAIDFEQELSILRAIRQEFSEKEMILRVDANGAFNPDEALEYLQRLSEYHIHSIEQPIRPRQYEQMAWLCEKSPIPIALDEELIGLQEDVAKKELLDTLKPAYIILKPALLGGFVQSETWIRLAEQNKIGWWVTSALESNVGLNAIAQWTSHLPYQGHQGLGTGQLYTNNINSPLEVKKGYLQYNHENNWDLERLNF
jgi:o-succinylbenzoate synthase